MFITEPHIEVEYQDGKIWKLLSDVVYLCEEAIAEQPAMTLITVPKGFVTDFASVPRIFWNIVAPTGKHSFAAIVHDWLYYKGEIKPGQPCTKAFADLVFKEAMREAGINKVRRNLMYYAVKWFGNGVWDTRREQAGSKRQKGVGSESR
jgi:hypothetical protein